MIDIEDKKAYLVDSSPVTFDWMIHKEDIEYRCPEHLAHRAFVDVHIVSIILGIEVGEIGFLPDETDSSCDPEFPRPVVRRGKQVRWRLKDLIQYIDRVAELRWHAHYEMELEELRSRQREPSGDVMISSYEITNQLAFDAHFTIRPLKTANRRPKWPHAVTARSKAGVIPVLVNGQEAD